MSIQAKIGLSLLVAGGLVALVNAWAFWAFPDQWGGPNIGGGFIQLLAYAAIVAGGTFLVAALLNRRRNRSG